MVPVWFIAMAVVWIGIISNGAKNRHGSFLSRVYYKVFPILWIAWSVAATRWAYDAMHEDAGSATVVTLVAVSTLYCAFGALHFCLWQKERPQRVAQ